MKLIHQNWTFEIVFKENLIQRLIIEDSKIFTEIVVGLQELIKGEETKWVLSECGKVLKASCCCDLIIDYFNLDINQRKMISSLYEKLEMEIYSSDLLPMWNKMQSIMQNIVDQSIDRVGYNIIYKDIDIKNCLKMLNASFEKCCDNSLECLLEYLELFHEVMGIDLFVLINVTTFFSKEELVYLYQQAEHKKYFLLLIDRDMREIDFSKENVLIIDKDACVFDGNLP